jgi:hypothetical protein
MLRQGLDEIVNVNVLPTGIGIELKGLGSLVLAVDVEVEKVKPFFAEANGSEEQNEDDDVEPAHGIPPSRFRRARGGSAVGSSAWKNIWNE